MTHNERKEILLNKNPTTCDEALQQLTDIQDLYDEVGLVVRTKVKPLYDEIKQIHDESAPYTDGLWIKRREVERQLVQLAKQKKAPVGGAK